MYRVTLQQIPSTMDEAKRLLENHKEVFVRAVVQTNGRGQQGRHWLSPEGGVYCTYGKRLHDSKMQLSGLSLAIGISLIDAFSLGERGIRVKWPNDLVFGSTKGKLTGILVETAVCGNEIEIFIGVGLNVLPVSPGQDLLPVSLYDLGLQEISTEAAATVIEQALSTCLATFQQQGFEEYKERFETLAAFKPNGRVQVATSVGSVVGGTFKGVTVEGALLLQDGPTLHTIASGHIVHWE